MQFVQTAWHLLRHLNLAQVCSSAFVQMGTCDGNKTCSYCKAQVRLAARAKLHICARCGPEIKPVRHSMAN
jgi:hypothetical protein